MAGVKAADRCPGLLRPHPAADGSVIRLRLPGGQTTADTLCALSGLAGGFGNPDLQLTSRGGLQLRGLPDPLPDRLVAAVVSLGLVPSPRHERARNIVASPFTGVAGGAADLRGLLHDLDRALLAEASLAELPGRFLFVLDDGRGDVLARPFDLGYQALGGAAGRILVGGSELGFPIAANRAVDTLIGLALDFVDARRTSGAWHVRELPDWLSRVDQLGPVPSPATAAELESRSPEPPLGAIGGAASVTVPLGLLTPAQAAAVVGTAPGPVVITPWRGLVVPGGASGLPTLVASGLIDRPDSPWSLISACVGAPHCAASAGSTRAEAAQLVARGSIGGRLHLSGCARRCGAPAGDFTDVVVSAVHRDPT
jgi:precorrin-3B synthase